MKHALLAHGIRTDGQSIFGTRPWFEELGYKVRPWKYGRINLLGAYFGNDNLAELMAGTILDLGIDLIVTHSNGAVIEHRALHILDQEGFTGKINLLRISPALNRRLPLANCVNRCAVMYTPHDFAVRAAAWLPFGLMGSMGAYGPISDDQRFLREEEPQIGEHSEWFLEPRRSRIAKPTAQALVRQLEAIPCDRL